jgi:hypothetical protein
VNVVPAELVTTPSTADAAEALAEPATIASTPSVPQKSVPPKSVPPGAARRKVTDCPTNPAALPAPVSPGALADVDGSGCSRPISVHGNALQVGDVRFALGEPGDQILIGDWDGDGLVTPAVFRKSSGELFRYDVWPAADTPVTGTRWRQYEPDVTVHVRRLPSGLDTIEEAR